MALTRTFEWWRDKSGRLPLRGRLARRYVYEFTSHRDRPIKFGDQHASRLNGESDTSPLARAKLLRCQNPNGPMKLPAADSEREASLLTLTTDQDYSENCQRIIG